MFSSLRRSLLHFCGLNKSAVKYSTSYCSKSVVKHRTHYSSERASFKTKDFKLHNLDSGPSTSVNVSQADAEKYYRQMKIIREMQIGIIEASRTHYVPGPTHLYTGQEACAVGILAAIEEDDAVVTAYRLHGYAYLKGVTMHKIMAEVFGRQTGGSKGKGGSMHIYNKSSHFYGGNGIVGDSVPVGTGIALALSCSKKDNICVTVYGDGAASQGQVFESFNMAKLWKLPVLFVCENNKKSRQETTERVLACPDLYKRGNFIPGIWVDGMDVLAVREATRWAANYIRSGHGPLVMELDTSYVGGHCIGHKTAALDKTQENEEEGPTPGPTILHRDPLTLFTERLSTTGLSSDLQIKGIDDDINKEVDEAINRTLQDPVPDVRERYTDIYMNTPNVVVRGCDVFSKYTSSNLN